MLHHSTIISSILAVIVTVSPSPIHAEHISDIESVVNGNSAFACDLYQRLKEAEGNLFISPYSISAALAMTYAGARGVTEREMTEVLHFGADQTKLHQAFLSLRRRLNAYQEDGNVQLNTANSLWCQKNYAFLDEFLSLNNRYYGASAFLVDFVRKTEAARLAINRWVADKTRDKITNLIQPGDLTSATALVLCNAIYFRGDWASQFDERRTIEWEFFVTPERSVQVDMMTQNSTFKWKFFDTFTILELPYEGDDLSMVIFLPDDVAGFTSFEKRFTWANLQEWLVELNEQKESSVTVLLPKFKNTWRFDIADILPAMGMPHVFHDADFSGMTGTKDLFVSNVIHEAFIEVNEQGTEAVASTAVIMEKSGVQSIIADHPFLFLIRDNNTGSVLFMGRVIDPTTTSSG